MEQARQQQLLAVYRDGLLDDTLPFWWPRSVDGEHGGFLLARDRDGSLLDDFSIIQGRNAIHVLNAPSPGATSSLAIGEHIAGLALENFGDAA